MVRTPLVLSSHSIDNETCHRANDALKVRDSQELCLARIIWVIPQLNQVLVPFHYPTFLGIFNYPLIFWKGTVWWRVCSIIHTIGSRLFGHPIELAGRYIYVSKATKQLLKQSFMSHFFQIGFSSTFTWYSRRHMWPLRRSFLEELIEFLLLLRYTM